MAYPPKPPSGPPPPRMRNQRTQALLRRDVAWQIVAPLGLAFLVLLVLAVLVSVPSGAATRSAWADVSLIFLILPAALFGLLALALVGGLCYGLYFALRELPYLFKKAQDFVALATYRVQRTAEAISNVFLSIRSMWAGARKAAQNVRGLIPVRRHR